MRRSISERGGRCAVRSAEEMMEILEAFDLVGTYRGAAALVGCDHKTVARLVELRDRAGGGALVPSPRARPAVDPFAEKIAGRRADQPGSGGGRRDRGRVRVLRAASERPPGDAAP